MSISTHLPEAMSPDERRTEIAELLACGLLRRRDDERRLGRSAVRTNSVTTCLEERREKPLSVPTG